MTRTKKRHDKLRQQGEQDFLAGKPIDTFFTLSAIQHTELERGSYETGWRDAKATAARVRSTFT